MTNTYTERMFLTDLLAEEAIQSNSKYVDKINYMLERLDKKNASRSGKPTKQQQVNIDIYNKIYEILDKPMTIDEIKNIVAPMFPDIENLSGQRITAVLTPHTQATEKYSNRTGEIFMEKVKRVSYYSRAGA